MTSSYIPPVTAADFVETPPASLLEAPRITNFADIPAEFWIAATIQILILVLAICALVKLVKFVINLPSRIAKPTAAAGPIPESIDDDFADIAAEMKKERDHA